MLWLVSIILVIGSLPIILSRCWKRELDQWRLLEDLQTADRQLDRKMTQENDPNNKAVKITDNGTISIDS